MTAVPRTALGLSYILRFVAALLLFIATLIGFGVFGGAHELGWIASGLFAWVVSTLVP